MKDLADSLLDFAAEVVFRLAGHFGQSERDVTCNPVEWFFDRWDRLQRLKYQEMVGRVSAVQAGTSRSLALAFSKKRKTLPSLPTYEEARGQAEDRALERTDPKASFWWLRPPKQGEGEGEEESEDEEGSAADDVL